MGSVEGYSYAVPPVVIKAQESVELTAHEGDLVQGDADGMLIIGTAAAFFAIAKKTHSGTSTGVDGVATEIEFLSADNLYVMRAGAATTTLQSDVNATFDITFTAGAHTIASNATAGVDGVIMSLHPEDGSKLAGRYIVRFLGSVIYGTAPAA